MIMVRGNVDWCGCDQDMVFLENKIPMYRLSRMCIV